MFSVLAPFALFGVLLGLAFVFVLPVSVLGNRLLEVIVLFLLLVIVVICRSLVHTLIYVIALMGY